MAMKHSFGNEQRAILDNALDRYLEMDAATREMLINDIEKTGELRVFGYGSLMSDPHIPPDLQYLGVVKGLRRDAIFSDRFYRGTPNSLGITMGVIAAEPSAELHGRILITTTDDTDPSAAPLVENVRALAQSPAPPTDPGLRVLDNIKALARREISFNPIYTYKLVDVESPGHEPVKAIICGTSTDHPQYIGPTVEQGDMRAMSFEEKACIIAASKGEPGASIRNTGLAYWRFVLHCTYTAGLEPEPYIKKLVSMSNALRTKVEPSLRAALEKLDDTPERAKFDPRVFERDETAMKLTLADLDSIEEFARFKLWGKRWPDLNGHDPLRPERFRKIEGIMKELAAK